MSKFLISLWPPVVWQIFQGNHNPVRRKAKKNKHKARVDIFNSV